MKYYEIIYLIRIPLFHAIWQWSELYNTELKNANRGKFSLFWLIIMSWSLTSLCSFFLYFVNYAPSEEVMAGCHPA